MELPIFFHRSLAESIGVAAEDQDVEFCVGFSRAFGLAPGRESNVGALIIGIGFWGPLHYNYNKEPPKNSIRVVI